MPTTTLTDLRKNALIELDDLWSPSFLLSPSVGEN